jgi:hypothetical protein
VLHVEYAPSRAGGSSAVTGTFRLGLTGIGKKAVSQFGRGRHPLIRLEAWIGQEGYA